MNPLKKCFFTAAKQLDINYLKKSSGLNLLVPFHHLVSDEYIPYIFPLYKYKNVSQFENDLDFLLKNFNPVSLSEVMYQAKQGRPFAKKSFLITFDDAFRNVFDVAMPILLKKGAPAAVFVSPPFVENKIVFYDLKKALILDQLKRKPPNEPLLRHLAGLLTIDQITVRKLMAFVKSINYLNKEIADQIGEILEIDFEAFQQKEKPFMSVNQLKKFIDTGFDVGAHSMTHPLYNMIPFEQQLSETQDSLAWVNNAFAQQHKVFAFPHVDSGVSREFFDHLFSCTQRAVPDLVFGNTTAMLEHNPKIVHRFIGENPAVSMEAMCKAVLLFNIINQARQKQYIQRN